MSNSQILPTLATEEITLIYSCTMKKVSFLSFLLAFWMGFGSMWAAAPFRKHRYDAFSVTPPKAGSIVMLGKSLPDMRPWAEAVRTTDGQPINIVCRGNSGTYSTEQNDNLESYLINHPSKIFIMIGTNDMATSGGLNFTPEQLLTQVRAMVKRIHLRSPETKV